MNKHLTDILNLSSDDQLFEYITKTFRDKITTLSWFVDWEKVTNNVRDIELSLNIMNYLIGKENFVNDLTLLILKNPFIVEAFPILLQREKKKLKY